MFDLIIVGGGPAGITAGIYAARKKIDTLLISKDFAGQVGKISSIDNWPGTENISGIEFLENLKKHLKRFTIDIKEGEEVFEIKKEKDSFEITTSQKNKYSAKAIIIASGVKPRLLGVPGEKEFIGRGISYCSTCDAPFFEGKTVAVIGGGNAGFEDALDLTKYAKKIYILEFSSEIRADEILLEQAKKNKKIEIILSAEVKEIKGKNFVSALVYQEKESKKIKELAVEGVFVQIGHISVGGFAKELVDFNEKNEIKIDFQTNETKTPGLFAAGDVTSIPFKQVVIAAGEGAKALLSCHKWLKNNNKI